MREGVTALRSWSVPENQKGVFWRAGTQNIEEWGWRLSLGLAAVPAVILTLGGALLPETPNSLVERGHPEEVRACSGSASRNELGERHEKKKKTGAPQCPSLHVFYALFCKTSWAS